MINFELFGLSNRDKRVYETLVTSPGSSVRSVAELTGINRGSVFESIKALLVCGLVSYVLVGERRRYTANDPEVLHELISERRRTLKAAHAGVDDYIKTLGIDRRDPAAFRFATFYEGDEGVAAVLRDVLTTCRLAGVHSYHSISSPKVREYMYHNFPHFTRERVKQGIAVEVIRFGGTARGDELARELAVPNNLGGGEVYTIIYADKTAFIGVDEYNYLNAVVIESQGVANLQRMLFEQTWRALGVAG